MVSGSRLPRTGSAASIASMQSLPAPSSSAPSRHTRQSSASSLPRRQSMLGKPKSKSALQQVMTPDEVDQNSAAAPSKVRSAIPRPVTMSSFTALSDRSTVVTAADTKIPPPSTRALQTTRSLQLADTKAGKGVKGDQPKENIAVRKEAKVLGKAKPEMEKEKPLAEVKRIPTAQKEPTSPVSTTMMRTFNSKLSSPPKQWKRGLKPRPQSDARTLFASSKLPTPVSAMRIQLPQIHMADNDSSGPDSPSPLAGSLAASRGRKSRAGTPNDSLTLSTRLDHSPKSSPLVTSFTHADIQPREEVASPTGSVSEEDSCELPQLPLPTPLQIRKPRPSIPDTPALRHLMRERELSRIYDLSGISEGDISLASSASFGQLTPPTRLSASTNESRLLSSPLRASQLHASHLSNLDTSLSTSLRASTSADADLHDAAESLKEERHVLETRIAALISEETRLRGLADNAMRDRQDALILAEEAEARRNVVVWDNVVQAIDEGIEEDMGLRSLIASLRAVVRAM